MHRNKKMPTPYHVLVAIFVLTVPALEADELERDQKAQYDVRFSLHVDPLVALRNSARLVLSSSASELRHVFDIRAGQMTLFSWNNDRLTQLWHKNYPLDPGFHVLLLKQRARGLVICLDNREIGVAADAVLQGRVRALLQPAPGFSVIERPRVQKVARIVFQDDFARAKDETGVWETFSGRFAVNASRNPGSSQSAFELWAEAPQGEGLAFARDSYWFWDDYAVGVSIKCTEMPATSGLAFHVIDAENLHLLKWSQHKQGMGVLELIRRRRNKNEVLARHQMNMPANQWLRLTVATYGTMAKCFIGSEEVAQVIDDALTGGRIGIFIDRSNGVYFDDVSVNSVGSEILHDDWQPNMPFGPSEQSWSDFSGTDFGQDDFMQQWSHPRSFWEKDQKQENFYWFRNRFFDNADFSWRHQGSGSAAWPNQAVGIVLFGERIKPESGYRLLLKPSAAELFRNDVLVAECAVKFDSLNALSFSATEGSVSCVINETPLLSWNDPEPLTKGEAGVCLGKTQRSRHRPDWRDTARVESTHRLDYGFQNAPVAWETQSGKWQSTHRWACSPDWSFFGGRGDAGAPGIAHGNAVLWNLRRFKGDFDAEFVLSPMEGTPQRVHFTRPVAFNVVFNADNRNFDSGYLLHFGTYDVPTRLFREGIEVDAWEERVTPNLRMQALEWYQRLTRVWQQIRIQRRGSKILIDAARHDARANYRGLERIFEYEDATPLSGERLGLWASGDNGMAIARVTISYEKSPGVLNPEGEASNIRIVKHKGGENEPAQFDRVENLQSGGSFCNDLVKEPLDLAEAGLLEFDVRLNSPLHLSLLIEICGQTAEVILAGPHKVRPFTIPLPSPFKSAPNSGEWQHVKIDLYSSLRAVFPKERLIAGRICLASPYDDFAEIAGLGVNRCGASYDLAELKWKQPSVQEVRQTSKPPQLRVSHKEISLLHDFEGCLEGWQRLGGVDGAALYRDSEAAKTGDYSLRLLNQLVGGPAGAWITKQRWNAATLPDISFDYKLSPGVEINLVVKANGRWFEIKGTGTDNTWPVIGHLADFVADGSWRHAEFALYDALSKRLRTADVQVEALAFADTWRMSTPQHLAYWIDNFQHKVAVDPEDGAVVELSFRDGKKVDAYSFLLDNQHDTVPPETEMMQDNSLKLEGAYQFLHIRGRDAQGRWSAPVHLRLSTMQVKELPEEDEIAADSAAVPPAPFISYIPSDRLCRNNFDFSRDPEFLESAMGEFRIRRGAWVLPVTDDGSSGKGCVEILNLNPNAFFSAYFRTSKWNVERWPRIAFDYKFAQSGCALNLSMFVNDASTLVEWTGTLSARNYFKKWVVGSAPTAVQNGHWQHVEFDLQDMLLKNRFQNPEIRPELTASELSVWATNHFGNGYRNPSEARLRVDNFTIFSPQGNNPAFEWQVPGNTDQISGYAFVFDSLPATVPPEEVMTTDSTVHFENVAPGTYYLHVRAYSETGNLWGETGHCRIEIANQRETLRTKGPSTAQMR